MILHTNVSGEGEAMVFLHTDLQTGRTDFQFQQDYFKQTYQIIAPDLRGHGNSFSENFNNYFHDSVLDLLETLESLNISQAHFAGNSLGALVAILFAQDHPQYVKSLTISGIIPYKPDQWKKLHHKEVDKQRQLLRNEASVAYFNQLHNTNWREIIYLERNENWYPFAELKSLPAMNVPILYIAGDKNVHELSGITQFSASNNFHVAVLPFASHYIHTEQPELYTAILEEFILKPAHSMKEIR